ncbi:hypothetical protein DMENIID0001_046320 [Sergentomyia squamirostris]
MKKWLLILLTLYVSKCSNCANILILESTDSPSHHFFIRQVSEGLVKQGHNVTSLISATVIIKDNSLANITYLQTDTVSEKYNNTNKIDFINYFNKANILQVWEQMNFGYLNNFKLSKAYRQLLSYPDDFKFDLILYDCTTFPILLGFYQKFRGPTLIGYSAFNGISTINYATGASYYPSRNTALSTKNFNPSFLNRVENFLLIFCFHYYRKYYSLPIVQSMLQDDFPNLPPLSEIEEKTKLVLVNYSPVIHDPEPILPNVIPVAGMHIKTAKPLTEEFEKILNSSENGLILFSVGTNVKTRMLGEDRIRKFLEVFRQLPQYFFLWKFDEDDIADVPKNVIIKKWLPQNDILAHPNTKLFISHCGLLSSVEATWYGVPILGSPVFWDQFANAHQLVKAGLAKQFNIVDFTTEEVKDLILKMMTNPKYSITAKNRSILLRDQPQPPLEKALWWIDFILRNPDVDFLQILYVCEDANCINILILETDPGPSHYLFISQLSETLVKQGHNITILIDSRAFLEQSSVKNLTYLYDNSVQESENLIETNHIETNEPYVLELAMEWEDYTIRKLKKLRLSKGYRQLLAYPNDFKFDLILYDCTTLPIFLGFHQKFNQPPLIGFASINGVSQLNYVTGSMFYPSFIPFLYNRNLCNSFFGRVKNNLLLFSHHYYRRYHSMPIIQSMLKDDFPDLPPLSEIEEKTKLVLVNYSPVIHDPEPILPNVIPVAGMHIKKAKPLTEEFEKILNSSENGLILFSVGTNVETRMLGEDRIRKFLEVFMQLPQYNFLWKFDEDGINDIPKNVIIKKWLPQNDILAHPNTKLFISHCGLLSSIEATWYGVPILGSPVFGDQFVNAYQLVKAGLAEQFNIVDFTTEEVKDLILKMMTIPKYSITANKRSILLRDHPHPPLEKALWWIYLVLLNPDLEFLQSKSKGMDLLVLHNIDVIAFFLVLPLILFLIILKLICLVICTYQEVNSANILFLETDSARSHHLFIRQLYETLVGQGHNVTFLIDSQALIDKTSTTNLTYLSNKEMQGNEENRERNPVNHMLSFQFSVIHLSVGWQEYTTKKLAEFKVSQGYLQLLAYPDDFKFDLILYDCTTVPIFLGFHHKFGQPPLIGYSIINVVTQLNYATGSPFYPSYIPFLYNRNFRNGFLQRIENFFAMFYNHYYRKYYSLPIVESMLKDDFPNLPPLSEIEEKTKLVLVNYSPLIHDPEPILPNVIPVAGMHIKTAKPLTEEFEKILNSSENGLILFSVGTNVETWMLGEDRIRNFLEAFRQLPQYNFLWKFDEDDIADVPKNVIIKKWLPQNDVLAHPNTKLFISHCGLLSTVEATWYGVPILGSPVFVDQFVNAHQLVKAGLAEQFNIVDFTTEEVKDLILKMMTNPKYSITAGTRSRLLRDQPQLPLETALWWIDFVLRNQNLDFLQSKSKGIDVLVLHSVDVIAFLLVSSLTFFFIMLKLVSCLKQGFSNKFSKKQKIN